MRPGVRSPRRPPSFLVIEGSLEAPQSSRAPSMDNPLNKLDHRPWPLPRGPWIMAQVWHDLLFAHWPVAPEILRPLVPASLELDTFEDEAWLGVVPFRMSGVRLRGPPALPYFSAFPEINVRTYVTHGNKPGVWFFSLDAANFLAVVTARLWFHLPYFHSTMSLVEKDGWIWYDSARIHRDSTKGIFEGKYRPTEKVFEACRGTIDHWLTERYCLYAESSRRLYRSDIHHRPWQLQAAEAEIAINTMREPIHTAPAPICPLSASL